MSDTPDNNHLKQLLKQHSVHYGDFTLASGKKSNVYGDCRLTTLRAEAMPLIGRALDRGSIARVMSIGSVVLAVSLGGMSRATAIWQVGIYFSISFPRSVLALRLCHLEPTAC